MNRFHEAGHDGGILGDGELGGVTGGTYIVLESDADVDAAYERAKAAGARITIELRSPEYGGRTFSAADPEGYLWSFGSYRPEAAPSP